ncbi:unnamed protein product [Moneuplotes crassus]|uniref:Uncharacterized protein n=1 Tax=Euplotes crassus TaxID=5936 RepID=A0AAD2CZY6_EUPCR|nr:unnamed protein product [Moneuplotes crassus]
MSSVDSSKNNNEVAQTATKEDSKKEPRNGSQSSTYDYNSQIAAGKNMFKKNKILAQSREERSAKKASRESLLIEGHESYTGRPGHNLLSVKKDYSILNNDKVLLSNRLIMLRKEEEKLMKKIKSTKEKAKNILEVKHRNEIKFKEKLEKEKQEEKETLIKRQKILKQREQKEKADRNKWKQNLSQKLKNYHEIRDQRVFAVQHKSNVRKKVVLENQLKRDRVKAQESRIQQKLRKRDEDRKKRCPKIKSQTKSQQRLALWRERRKKFWNG